MLEALTHEDVSSDAKDPRAFYPRLVSQISLYSDRLVLSQHGREFVFPSSQFSGMILSRLFSRMDGAHSLHELQTLFSSQDSEAIATLINNLDRQGLVDNAAPVAIHSGADTLRELEALAYQLLAPKLFDHRRENNQAWLQLLQLPISDFADSALPDHIVYGFALEHWYLFSQMSCFQSPTLSFQGSVKIRQLLNELYQQTYGHEQLMVEALSRIGLTSDDLRDVLPLPQTVSITNGLAFWSNFEPLFFFSILGILFTTVSKSLETYLAVIENHGLDNRFVEPIRQLINAQQKAVVTAQSIFREIPHIDLETKYRFESQIHLFSEMVCNFYRAIGLHYLDIPHLLRRIEAD